ncbi:MAG: outer membrane protein assembly factor BamD [Bacteroidaceae bacterium]|nr:outer membrane protein assembly factor BamD [Bacteroidaceae bacterium]MBQ9293889.1 outer membrane protein assembly factor BamD [Bacteroidaceae bacterium]
MRMRRLYSLLFAACFLLLGSCSEYTAVLKSSDYEYKYEAAKALYADGHYRQAAELFGLLLAPLKGTSYGEESLYMLGESNLKAKDYESAVLFFKKYYQLYPKGAYMEMSRYNSGYSLYKQTPDVRLDQSSTMEAIKEFQSFLDYCPETNLKEQAHAIIYEMQDKLVEKEYLSAKLYFDLGTYTLNSVFGGNNYEACVVTAQNALKDYPYASAKLREELSILVLRAKYDLAKQSVDAKRMERFRDAIDEFYAFQSDYPESQYMKEAQAIHDYAERIVAKKSLTSDPSPDGREKITEK